jgi:hypothetical protein
MEGIEAQTAVKLLDMTFVTDLCVQATYTALDVPLS